MTSAATGDASLAPSTERLERPALADRPAITTPSHLLPQDVLEARRERLSRQPLLGLAGLLLVVPTALLLAFGAGGAEPSVLVLAPLVTFALPAVVMVAFWWEDWPGTRLPARWSGWFDTLLIAVAAVVLTGLGQIVVGHLDLRGIFDPTPGPGNAPTFPASWPYHRSLPASFVTLPRNPGVTTIPPAHATPGAETAAVSDFSQPGCGTASSSTKKWTPVRTI